MKSIKLFTLTISSFAFLAACAETSTCVDSKANLAAGSLVQVNYFSGRLVSGLKLEECPGEAGGWHKENLSSLARAADACAEYKKIDRLEMLANHIAKTFATEPWGAFYLSIAAEQKADLARALWMIELALKKSPKNAILLYQRGRIHWSLNEIALAVADYNEALKFNPKLSDAHIILAQLAARNQDYKGAQKHYLAVVDVESENHKVFAALAENDLKLNQVKDSVSHYETAVNLSPRNVEYRMRLAVLYEVYAKDYDQALSVYRKLKSLLSENRAPSNDSVATDVNDKIKKLEALVSPTPKDNKKIMSAAPMAKNAQVKK